MAETSETLARAHSCLEEGAFGEAIQLLSTLTDAGGDDGFDAALLLGRTLIAAGRLPEAIEALQKALAMAAGDGSRTARVFVLIAVASDRLGAEADAAYLLEQALELDASLIEARTISARLHARAGRFEEAEAVLAPALAAAPADEAPALAQAMVMAEAGRLEAAKAVLEDLLHRHPESGEALANLGNVLRDLGLRKKSREHFDAALEVLPPPSSDYARARVNRAMVRFIQGDFAGGWADYEFRLRLPEARSTEGLPPPFRGARGDACGMRLLVYPEQGIGDIVMFATLLPELAGIGADIRFWAPERLLDLFTRSLDGITVEPDPGAAQQGEHAGNAEASLALGSVGRLLRPLRRNFNGRGPRPHAPLLKADPERVAHWAARLEEMGPRPHVGMSWRGGATNWDRSLRHTEPADWRALFADRGMTLVSLQFGASADEVRDFGAGAGGTLHHVENVGEDADDLTAVIAALDGVVSMDNSTVHFAGALAQPTVTLVPHVPTWRWGEAEDTSLWYPTMRIVRNEAEPDGPGAWAEAIAQAAALLPTLMERDKAARHGAAQDWNMEARDV
ncbi:MAG TPA: tetratricopeptide repeat protein [Alphaproteobacteria bacterium]|nr:tetratricopeptide repeat protein [Alphaproteobacteria bacterium]